ncbi:unnamed protein product [Brugia pahangi]|uniref:Phosphoserine phosphatase n=1 Tax=Brugia pahangi TaxID=6280 RepID=A0A0N4SZ98_BRUPA|nr:unnamed protein product [Brugia pahangi]
MIDEFAKYLHCYEVAKFSEETMNGEISFRESLKIRLKKEPKLTSGGEALVAELHRRFIPVYLISGSFFPVILPVAKILKIPETNIYTNEMFFDENGFCIGFDETRATGDSGFKDFGKAAVCRKLKDEKGYRNLVMIGDSVTDLEASAQADLFIGFGGNRCPDVVERKALWFTYNFDTLRTSLINK